MTNARTALLAELLAGEDPASPEYADARRRIERLVDAYRAALLAKAGRRIRGSKIIEPGDDVDHHVNDVLEQTAAMVEGIR
ncbi:hypothetical protein AB0O91_21145 [Kitasatospora sp. NPDC089797]|uniref:hypothetical protein n=1 Tax=Kitasatospora sp. NPDC089797 TaxID=3155298 RepID=UPI0034266079